jgi:ATP-dependent helicase/nuclease subunit A
MSEKTEQKLTLNPEQEAAVIRKTNTVVTAGAGSGKTSVLASRYAYLVTEAGLTVDSILTLTFTRKAAAEMYRRIYTTLVRIAAEETGIRQERARAAVRGFFRARIQTLDSYSASIVKQAAVRYGIAPDFIIDDERCRVLAETEALPFLIAHRHHPAIEQLYRQKRPQDIAARLFAETAFNFSALDDPPDFAAETEKQFAIVAAEWEKALATIEEEITELVNIVIDDDGSDAFVGSITPLVAPYTNGAIAFPAPADLASYFAALSAAPGAECVAAAETHPLRPAILRSLFFLYDLSQANKRPGKRSSRAKNIIEELRRELGGFSSLAVFCMQGGIILSLMRLLNEFQKNYLEKKRREKALSFSDAARLARSILRDHPDIRQSEKETFEKIMIDEFQDNNELQKELLFLLAEKQDRLTRGVPGPADVSPEKLFFVGDEKQSIYRFRGADVSVFRKLRDELSGGSLSLKTNYRSVPRLIGAFNALFGGSAFDPSGAAEAGVFPAVFAPESSVPGGRPAEPLPPFEAAYSPLKAKPIDDGQPAGDEPPDEPAQALNIFVLDTGAASGADRDEADDENGAEVEQLDHTENEALFVAEKIRDLLNTKDAAGARKYNPDDIAILFRSHNPQRAFEKHLRLLNIPYAAEGITGFFSDGPVNDMLAVLRLIAYPRDAEAYAVTLRSPFAGLSIGGLAAGIAVFNEAKSRATGATPDAAPDKTPGTGAVPAPLPFSDETLPLLDGPDREAFLSGQHIYRNMCAWAKSENSASLLSRLWYDEGYRYETEWRPETASFRELYDYLFALAVKADGAGMSLANFTDSLLKKRDDGEAPEDGDIPLERSGAVRLMTIHKSKGLEFPVVFLVGSGNKSRNSSLEGDVYRTSQGGIALSPPLPPECAGRGKIKRNFFYEQSLEAERRKRTAELRRLLYVAMTRAEHELYITGSCSLGRNAEPSTTENLPARLAAAIQEKQDKQKINDEKNGVTRIPGDAVIDNDTLFGLLLPALCARLLVGRLPAGRLPGGAEPAGAAAFFSLESIPVYTGGYIRARERAAGAFRNDRAGLSRFIGAIAPAYEKAAACSTPDLPNLYRSPTSFRGEAADTGPGAAPLAGDPVSVFRADPDHSGPGAADIFGKVDPILARRAGAEDGEAGFTAADFGIIAHACVESLLNGERPVLPPGQGGRLRPEESGDILDAGIALAERFIQSPLGEMARNAPLRKSEYSFRSLAATPEGEQIFINGTIDLLFEDEHSVYVVDFKTDSRENPAEHIPQMSFYYRAAVELRGKPCRLWLYYLRTGRAVDMTGAAACTPRT